MPTNSGRCAAALLAKVALVRPVSCLHCIRIMTVVMMLDAWRFDVPSQCVLIDQTFALDFQC